MLKLEQQGLSKVELVRKWGSSNADAVLDKQCNSFYVPGIEGFIGYKFDSNTAIVFGDPVASPNNQKILAEAFAEKFPNTVYIAVSEPFASWALKHVCKASLEFGEELFFDPYYNPKDYTGTHASLVRRKVRHAEKEHTIIKEYSNHDADLREKILQVGKIWLQARSGPQIHISNIHIFENDFGKRWFFAEKDNNVVAVVILNKLQSKNGYLLNHLMITPDAPHGTPELLFISVLEKLKAEGCSYVTVGSVPLPKPGKIQGFYPFFAWAAKFGYGLALKIFRLSGRSKFWEKFHPQSKPSFVLFSRRYLNMQTINGVIRALNAKM